MVKTALIAVFLFFGLLILAVRRRREEDLDGLSKKIGLTKQSEHEALALNEEVFARSFLFAKGAYYEIRNSYSRKDPEHHLIDLKYSSSGNANIGFQRLVFVLKTTTKNIKPFVLENPDKLHRTVTKTSLMAANFTRYEYNNRYTYVKSASIEWYNTTFNATAKKLVQRYPDICIEFHLGHFIAYQNRSNVRASDVGEFYNVIVRQLLPFFEEEKR